MMNTINHEVEIECTEILNIFFDRNLDPKLNEALRKRSLKALRFLAAGDRPLLGKPAGWAAGIVYALDNRERNRCGITGVLNKDAEELFGVKMGTIRTRATQIDNILTI
jgi:hypothetical protein